jgi:hypothetical protein
MIDRIKARVSMNIPPFQPFDVDIFPQKCFVMRPNVKVDAGIEKSRRFLYNEAISTGRIE